MSCVFGRRGLLNLHSGLEAALINPIFFFFFLPKRKLNSTRQIRFPQQASGSTAEQGLNPELSDSRGFRLSQEIMLLLFFKVRQS